MRVNTRYINSSTGTSSGGIYGPCIYTHARRELPYRRLRSLLLCLCYEFPSLINSLVCWFCTRALGLVVSDFWTHLVSSSTRPRLLNLMLLTDMLTQRIHVLVFHPCRGSRPASWWTWTHSVLSSTRPRFLAQMLLTDTLTQRIHVLVFILAEVLGPPAGGPGDEQPHGHGDRAAVLPAVSRPPAADADDLGGRFRSARRGGGRHEYGWDGRLHACLCHAEWVYSESESEYLLSQYKFTGTFVLRCTVGNRINNRLIL